MSGSRGGAGTVSDPEEAEQVRTAGRPRPPLSSPDPLLSLPVWVSPPSRSVCCSTVRRRLQSPHRKGPRHMKAWDSAAQFTDTIRMAIHTEERVDLSGSQQDLMSGQEDSPVSTPILGRRNTSECSTPHSTHLTAHSPHMHTTHKLHACIAPQRHQDLATHARCC